MKTHSLRLLWIFAITFPLLARAASAEIINVSSRAELNAALARVNPGDEINALPAQYGFIEFRSSGLPDAQIILRGSGAVANQIRTKGFDDLMITGWDIQGVPMPSQNTLWASGIIVESGSERIDIIGNSYRDTRSYAICLEWNQPFPKNITIALNDFDNCQSGFHLIGSDILAEYNTGSNLRFWTDGPNGDCDWTRMKGNRITVRNNYFHGADLKKLFLGPDGRHNYQIPNAPENKDSKHVDGGQTWDWLIDFVFTDNVIIDAHQGLLLQDPASAAGPLTSIRDHVIEGNIFALTRGSAIASEGAGNVSIRDNIFYDGGSHFISIRMGSTASVSGNVLVSKVGVTGYWKDGASSWLSPMGGNVLFDIPSPSPRQNDLIADPMFRDPLGDLSTYESVRAGFEILNSTVRNFLEINGEPDPTPTPGPTVTATPGPTVPPTPTPVEMPPAPQPDTEPIDGFVDDFERDVIGISWRIKPLGDPKPIIVDGALGMASGPGLSLLLNTTKYDADQIIAGDIPPDYDPRLGLQVFVRWSSPRRYGFHFNAEAPEPRWEIKLDGGPTTRILAFSPGSPPTPGDRISISAIGNTIRGFINGDEIVSVIHDGPQALTGGRLGVAMRGGDLDYPAQAFDRLIGGSIPDDGDPTPRPTPGHTPIETATPTPTPLPLHDHPLYDAQMAFRDALIDEMERLIDEFREEQNDGRIIE